MTPAELQKLDVIEAKEGHDCMRGETYPQRYVDALNAEIRNLKGAVTALTAERDALREDKERLDWLSVNHEAFADELYRIGWNSPTDAQWNKIKLFLRRIRHAIDAARKEKP